ncbi:MAG TPA: SCO family protein [Vicinamibacterales bacterium]|nr:SCO family protein [Vicinamibacterales bacterium]
MTESCFRSAWRHVGRPLGTALFALALLASQVSAQPSRPRSVPPPGKAASEQIPILREVGIDQKLGAQVPLDLTFVDVNGRDVKLGDLFRARPVILALVYYECPMLCTQVLSGIDGSLTALSFSAGQEFDIVVVSFDPGETPALAADRRKTFLNRYRRAGAENGVTFLTGRQEAISRLADAVGFRYAYDQEIDQFAHPAAITVLTGDGRVSRYLYGIEFAPRDLRLGIVEASEGRIGTAVDEILLFCYHYDPESGKYGMAIMNFIRLGGVLTVVGLGVFILVSLRRERRVVDARGAR